MTRMMVSTASVVALLGLSGLLVQVEGFTVPVGSTTSTSSVLGVTADPTFTVPDTSSISEVACRETAERMERIMVPVSDTVTPEGEVGISYVKWAAEGKKASSVPLFLVHGFDSSCLEYRRLGSQMAARGVDTYAVDLLGWGYTQLEGVSSFSAAAKIEALKSFITEVTGGNGPYCIAGASLGGASAIELAAADPDSCQGLVLIDAQGFTDGVGPMATLPRPLAELGVQVLKSNPLRSFANQISYFDPETFATDDAVRVGRLHCLQDGWSNALVSFMLSGGFSPSQKVGKINIPTLVLWGRQDGILEGKEFADKFIETLPNGRLQWIEECGHVPHLEKPEETADAITEYLSSDVSVPGAGGLSQQSLVVGGIVGATAVAAVANIL